MRELLVLLTSQTILALDLIALAVIIIGTIEAVFGGIVTTILSPTGHKRREVWLRYGRWLVAALTFQLAADIVETSISEDWVSIGRIGAVAVIRTFLNYFLERDIEEVRHREAKSRAEPTGVAEAIEEK